jgi:outer membrane protein OmpA-like peptidoglycan-associated protein
MIASGCQTISDQSPVEVKEAAKSVKAAEKADVEDYMPSAMESARRKLNKSVSLLEDADRYAKDNHTDQARSTQQEAINTANQAKAIADGAVKLVGDLHSYDANSGQYLAMSERQGRATQLQAEVSDLRQRNAELEQRLTTAANQPPTEQIPADFRVRKPIAFFATGSATVEARYRDDIADLANMLKSNDDLEVRLEGFADPRGSAEKNKQLAEERIAAVAEVLKEAGVPEDRIQMVPIGATADASSAVADRGRLQLDRKVTATITAEAH